MAASSASATAAPPRFTIVSCVKSRPSLKSAADTALARAFLPSLVRTVTTDELRRWSLSLYLCADDTDMFYVRHAAAVRNLTSTLAPWLNLQLLFYPATKNRVPNREATLQAYTDGAEYVHRTNDDISFMTSGWITAAVSALRQMHPPNIGVVGPKVYGDGIRGGATTLDVVHRTHLDIFADYYPPQLDNWFVDDWIAFTYTRGRARRTFVLHRHSKFPNLDWTVQHVFTHGRRYKVAMSQKGYLPALIECGRDAVDAWINQTERASAACASGAAAPPPWPRVSCKAVEKLPPPSPPPLPPKVGKRRGGKNGGGDGGDGDDGNKKVEAPEQRCQLRSEKVMPLEKAGFYSQAAGYCATLYAWHAPPCAAAAPSS